MKLFVTGGAGFIGSNFIRHVLACGKDYSVVNFDKLTYAGNLANLESVASNPAYQFIKGDICDSRAIQQAIEGCESIVHFAAESHVDRSIYEPAPVVETNITGTFTLLQTARKVGIRRFIHISTDEVYGDLPAGVSADESFPLLPNSPYSASKAGADLLVRSFVRTYGIAAIITRSSNNYGPFQFPEKFIPLIITNALEGKPVPVYGDGLQQRNWVHVEDNCRALVAVLERGRAGEIYNVGGPDVVDNLTMVRRILRLLKRPDSLIQFVADRPGHDRRYALDSSRIERELGWRPQISLEDGLEQTVDWYSSNPRWVEAVRDGEYRKYYEKFYERRDKSLCELNSAGNQ